jgi:omega-amidase
MRVHLVQYDIVWEDKPANHELVRGMLEGVDLRPGDLVLLPEMFDTGFSINVGVTAADPQRSEDFLRTIATEHGVRVIASIPVRPEGEQRCRNRCLVYSPNGELETHYDKAHPFTFGRESEAFTGGERIVIAPIDVPSGDASSRRVPVCPTVCYDLRFPELYRAGVDAGAEVFTIVANWPAPRQAHWRALIIARAIENQAWVLAVNRVGSDPHLSYLGGSLVVDPKGEVVAEGDDTPGVISAEVDIEAIRRWREKFPALRDRRRPDELTVEVVPGPDA